MEMPKKETLDKVLDYKVNYQDKETLEKVRELYDMSRSLLLDGYKNDKLHKNYDSYELEIKPDIKSAIKTGYYRIILSYDPSDRFTKYFSIYALNWHKLPKILANTIDTNEVMDIGFPFFKGSFNRAIASYEPGKWEEIIEKKYKEMKQN